MSGLQRSAVSFRRQGSSGLVWDDKFLGELNRESNKQQQELEQAAGGAELQQGQDQQQQSEVGDMKDVKPPRSINTMERSRSNGGGARGYRAGRVPPALEPPSPRLSVCGFCGAFGKPSNNQTKRAGKRRSR